MNNATRAAIAVIITGGVLFGGGIATAGSGGGVVPGSPGGNATDPSGPVVVPPSDPADCGEHVGPGTGPDATVSYTPCPGDDPYASPHPIDVEPRPGMVDVHPIGWDKAAVSGDGRYVTVRFWTGVDPCYVLDHVDVAYGADAITITLFQGHDGDAGDVACIDIAMLASTTITLDQPLAGRTIADGADG